jgi:endoglucanase
MEALRLFKERLKGGKRSSIGLFAVSTVQEELGLRGARTSCFGIDPVAGIAVDVTHASDNPGAEAREIGTVKMGDGPTIARGANINPVLESLLHSTARKKRIKVQPCPSPSATGTDANAIQVSRAGVAAALIGIPNRYMHTSTEMVDLRDVVSASKLVAETVLSITSRTSFIPV